MKFKHFILALVVTAFVAIECQAATLKSDLITNASASPVTLNKTNVSGGVLRSSRAIYTLTGSEASADVIQMITIPKGSIVNRELSTIAWDDCGTTFTVGVGDGSSTSRYCSALVMGTVGSARVTFEEAVGIGLPTVQNEYSAEDTIDIICTTVGTPTAAATISINLVYTTGY